METGKLVKRLLQKIRSFQTIVEAKTPLQVESAFVPDLNSLKDKLESKLPDETNIISIYRVPINMRQAEIKAYDPNIVSIGPYHRGLAQLQAMEDVKLKYLNCLLDQSRDHGSTFNTLFDAMKSLEGKTRACYSETINLSSDELIQMMVVDGCFVLELFRQYLNMKQVHNYESIFTTPPPPQPQPQRWMFQLLRRDLIKLENQIPIFVLRRLFDLTRSSGTPDTTSSLTDLALNFFNPLMPRDELTLKESIATIRCQRAEHLLGLFRSSLIPPRSTTIQDKQPHMFRSIKELQEAGVKLEKRGNHVPLDANFTITRRMKIMKKGVLKIPPFFMDDYTGTVFRNIVAFEQCHQLCKPDVTSYLFFIDSLINSDEDVRLLHDAGVIRHSLGSDKEVAKLVNLLCREVTREVDESYLHALSVDLNKYCNRKWNRWRAEWVHTHFNSPWALISFISAFLLVSCTVLQTWFDYKMYCNQRK